MSGTNESRSAKELVDEWDNILDSYEHSVGLPKFESETGEESEVEKYLKMNRDTLEKLDAEECSYIAFILSKYAFNVQRAQNRETTRVSWATRTIKHLVANEVGNFKAYSYEERLSLAIKNNEHAIKLQQILIYAEQRANSLNYLSRSLQSMAEFMKSIGINKGRDNG